MGEYWRGKPGALGESGGAAVGSAVNKRMSIEDEVLGNIRQLPMGPFSAPTGTVGDLNLPLEFLRRVADRVIQASFRERWRVVVGDGVEHTPPPAPEAGAHPAWVTVLPERSGPEGRWEEFRPADRHFRAPILGGRNFGPAAGFWARPENDRRRIEALRVQLTGPGYYAGPEDGGSLDILRQLVAACTDVTCLVSVEQRHAAGVLANMRMWTPGRGVRVVLIPEPLTISQWARDNAIAGESAQGNGARLLAPRWAGRGEEGGIFNPGESFLMDGLAAAGVDVAQSPLLFEAGNLLLVEEAERRILLIGEAEACRNVGLAREETVAAFKSVFAADECVILPAASFHIDLELTVAPASEGRPKPVAFVPDSLAAVRVIGRLAAGRLREAGFVNKAEAAEASRADVPFPKIAGPIAAALLESEVAPGRHGVEFASRFRLGQTDSGVGNLQRVRFASDWLMAELGIGHDASTHAGAYLRALRRTEKDRAVISRQLRQLGWKVVRVPAISAEAVSLNALNGLWMGDGAKATYFMPSYGGFFEDLDEAAAAVIRGEGFDVVKVSTGETQRRGGGLHCAVELLAGRGPLDSRS